jgi:hypothetical protein
MKILAMGDLLFAFFRLFNGKRCRLLSVFVSKRRHQITRIDLLVVVVIWLWAWPASAEGQELRMMDGPGLVLLKVSR